MTINESIKIPAHHNIYNGHSERELRIDFSIPKNGTNEETGLFIFVPGFGGHIDSNVYKKMREQFAERYNVVTMQCDYFGSRFMQTAKKSTYNLNTFKHLISKDDAALLEKDPLKFEAAITKYSIQISLSANLDETYEEFADMSYMQAIDVITAIEAVKIILRENGLEYNEDRVLGYGQSQGAYLLHLANKLVPYLFSHIIDNAAWVQPVYLYKNRYLNGYLGKALVSTEFQYIAKELIQDKKALSLHSLYKNFINGASIYSCIGTTDNLVDVQDKYNALKNLKFVNYEIIDSTKVDGIIFKSTNHGLDADFLALVDYALKKMPPHKNNKRKLNYIVASSQTQIEVDYSNGLPLFYLLT